MANPRNAGAPRRRDVPPTIGRAQESATHDRGVTTDGDDFDPALLRRSGEATPAGKRFLFTHALDAEGVRT